MPERSAWREVWSPFRIELIDRSAKSFVQRRHEATAGAHKSWEDLSDHERWAVTEGMAEFALAMDAALANMADFFERWEHPDE